MQQAHGKRGVSRHGHRAVGEEHRLERFLARRAVHGPAIAALRVHDEADFVALLRVAGLGLGELDDLRFRERRRRDFRLDAAQDEVAVERAPDGLRGQRRIWQGFEQHAAKRPGRDRRGDGVSLLTGGGPDGEPRSVGLACEGGLARGLHRSGFEQLPRGGGWVELRDESRLPFLNELGQLLLRLDALGLGGLQRLVQLGELGREFGRRDVNGRLGVAAAAIGAHAGQRAGLLDAVEEGEEGIELALGDGVVFVVVAAAAVEGQAQPSRARRLHAVNDGLDTPLLRDEAALAVDAVVAVEARGDERVEVSGSEFWVLSFREQVAGELPHGELVEAHVLVEGFDDPVAPRPHRARAVGLEAVAVGVAGVVEPEHRHALAVARGGEQAIHGALVGVRRPVSEEGVHLGGRGRNASEVEGSAAQECGAVGFGGEFQPVLLQPREQVCVDGIADWRRARALRGHERPVRRVVRALGHPTAERVLLRGGQRLVRLRRGHEVGRGLRAGAFDER